VTHSITDYTTSDVGRQLTIDVAAMALALPVVAREVFSTVVVPFVYGALLIFVVLFMIPFRNNWIASKDNAPGLAGLRTMLIAVAVANIFIPGFRTVEVMSIRWVIMLFVAVLSLLVLAVDVRRALSSR